MTRAGLVLAVALLAGCAGMVGAEPEPSSGVYLEGRPCLTSVDELGKTFARCFLPGLKGDLIVDVLPSHCLAKMEAAMRAMEKWHDIEGDILQRLRAGGLLKDLEVKWNEAKRACWRKP